MPLTAEVAQRMIRASQDKARELGVAVSTAILDPEGRLFAFGRMEDAPWIAIEVSQAKAFTGALLRRDGADLANDAARHVVGVVGRPGPGPDAHGQCHHFA